MSERVVILGGGESGIGAARLAMVNGLDVFLSDAGSIAEQRKSELEALGVDYEAGGHDEPRILNADLVVKSPGIPDNVTLIQKLIGLGIPVISEIEFAYRFIDKKSKVIAITGTNGKTTTTLLTHHLLKHAGLNVAVGGNVGTSLAGLVAEGNYDYYVVEVSSFQLDGIQQFKPNVAVLLNITPDHLDRYDNDFSKYVTSKFHILENLSQNECFIYCKDSEPITEELSLRKVDASMFALSTVKNTDLQAYLDDDRLIFNYEFKGQNANHEIPLSEISLIGKHNMVNSMAAILSTLCMEVPISKIVEGLKTFVNAPHRLELVGTIEDVAFINDSKATNIDATFYALDGVKGEIIWIVGGVDKGNDYSELLSLVESKVKAIICLGVDNSRIKEAFGHLSIPIQEFESVKEVVGAALGLSAPGNVALLSPACASFDLFKNYEDRGDQFRSAVNQLVTQTSKQL